MGAPSWTFLQVIMNLNDDGACLAHPSAVGLHHLNFMIHPIDECFDFFGVLVNPSSKANSYW